MRTLRNGALVGMLMVGMLAVSCIGEPIDNGGDVSASRVAVNHLSDITILSVDGTETNAHTLSLPELNASTVRLEIRDSAGNATVISEAAVSEGVVVVPPFHNDFGDEVVTVDVYVDSELYGGIDVYTAAALPVIPEDMELSVLCEGENSMLIDLSLTEGVESSGVFGSTDDLLTDGLDRNSGNGVMRQALSSCGNGWWGPGVGRFLDSYPGPGTYGRGFSYCPESVSTLNWAAQGDFAIDAIYNENWGCTLALKVPNNCTETVSAWGGMTYCCGFPYFTPSWINPSLDPYFPNCPLTD